MNSWLYAIFTAFAIVHLFLFFRDRSMAAAKIASSLALLGLIALLATSFSTWLGWPAGAPERGVKYSVLAVDICQPSPDRPGHIYVWLSGPSAEATFNPFQHLGAPGEPRAYEVPFTPPAEKAMQKAGKALREGHSVSATFGDDTDADGPDGEPGQPGDPSGQRGDPQNLNGRDTSAPKLIIDEPDTSIPPK